VWAKGWHVAPTGATARIDALVEDSAEDAAKRADDDDVASVLVVLAGPTALLSAPLPTVMPAPSAISVTVTVEPGPRMITEMLAPGTAVAVPAAAALIAVPDPWVDAAACSNGAAVVASPPAIVRSLSSVGECWRRHQQRQERQSGWLDGLHLVLLRPQEPVIHEETV
jgi:hypothetical protein